MLNAIKCLILLYLRLVEQALKTHESQHVYRIQYINACSIRETVNHIFLYLTYKYEYHVPV